MQRLRAIEILSVLLCLTGFCAAGDTLLDRAYDDMYNLQFEQAHSVLEQYQAQRPEDPLGPVSDAAACLFSEFDRLHILQSEFLTDDKKLSNSKAKPDPAVKLRFDSDLAKAQRLAAAQLSDPKLRANAMLAEILRYGLSGDYSALIENRDLAALRELKKGRALAEQLIAQYPTYYDAYIAIGVENYVLSQKPAPLRWALRATGSKTDKEDGLRKLRMTAAHGHFLLPYARLLLAIAALRDGDRQTARQLLIWLAGHYPQNSLYRAELAKLG